MGGPGFFSLELEQKDKFPRERLCLCLWAACEWLLLDQRWIAAHPNQWQKQKPLQSDEVTKKLTGKQIIRILAEGSKFEMQLSGGSIIEFPDDPNQLPFHGGSLSPRKWCPGDNWLDAWVYAKAELWIS